MTISLVIWVSLFAFGVYAYLRYRNADNLWMMVASGALLGREIMELTGSDSLLLNGTLFVIGLAALFYSMYLSIFVDKLLNKDYPLIIETIDIDDKEKIDLEMDRIASQIIDKDIKLKNGSKLWITDGLADGIAVIKKVDGSWVAINKKRTNRFVSANWPFHSNKLNK